MTLDSSTDLVSLHGRRAIVTGAAQGFGFAIAERLAQAGAEVLIADMDEAGAASAAERLTNDYGSTCTSTVTDISDEQAVSRMFDERPRVDLLVNNAGVFSNAMAWNLSGAEFDRIHRVNVLGTFLCCREFLRRLAPDTRPANIVNVASVDALNPSCEGQVHYTSSKHAIAGLTKSLSVEAAPLGVRVNAVCPGASMTEGALSFVEAGAPDGIDLAEQWAGITSRTPLRRLIDPDDVARAVLFLASEMASSITGVLLPVDGGILSQPLEGYESTHDG